MWSYLRRFSQMTKEMRPAHRVDVLSHALLYYGFKTKQKLGKEEFFYVCNHVCCVCTCSVHIGNQSLCPN